jgi:endonuclease/exonuclease/phosphatase family metal-dependent hydrolase
MPHLSRGLRFRKPLLVVFTLLFACLSGSSFSQNLKVISYNIHHGANAQEELTLAQIGDYIKNSGADLVGLQEVDSLCRRSGSQDQMKLLADMTGMNYAFYRHFAYDGGAYGLGILSRFPILEQKNDRITSIKNGKKESLAQLSVRVAIGGKEILFSTVHLALDQGTRLIQAREVLEHLSIEIPVILTGDFNALPDTEEIQLIHRRYPMQDSSLQPTFPHHQPIKKIDYIFADPRIGRGLTVVRVPVEILHSDHLPLEAEFSL